jgi:hypothetical protein
MQRIRDRWPAVPTVTVPLACVVFGSAAIAIAAEPNKDEMIRDALTAARPAVASTAKVVTMDNKVLKEGTDAYVCISTEADKLAKGLREPMCLDKV